MEKYEGEIVCLLIASTCLSPKSEKKINKKKLLLCSTEKIKKKKSHVAYFKNVIS